MTGKGGDDKVGVEKIKYKENFTFRPICKKTHKNYSSLK